MLDYKADPDIQAIMADGRLTIPDELDEAEAGRLDRFLTCDQVLERFYRENPPSVRPPENDLRAAAETAMAVYDQRSERLSVGWQKFAVLQAGIAGSPDNLDSADVQEWAYCRLEENPNWLTHEDTGFDRKPLDWLGQVIGAGVLFRRQLMEEPPSPPKRKGWFGR